jgi:hypothetical protein
MSETFLRPLVKGLRATAVVGGTTTMGLFSAPFVSNARHKMRNAEVTGLDSYISAASKANQDKIRRENFETQILTYYVPKGKGKIDWHQLADIVDFVAQNTQSDEDFRQDIWYLFGWRENGQRSPIAAYLDPTNTGLPKKFHNSTYQDEQMHHYLGGTTGNTDRLQSHLLNNPIYSVVYEMKELLARGAYNWGDVRLFNVSQKHRNAFLKEGRFSVAPNIRALLATP